MEELETDEIAEDPKVRARDVQLVCCDIDGNKYYTVKWYDLDSKRWIEGYGSYDLSNVTRWIQEHFEVESKTEEERKAEWHREEIARTLGDNELYMQLAEECAELIQAIVKYRRSCIGLTPKSCDDCKSNLVEELADVSLLIEQIMYLQPHLVDETKDIKTYKTERWHRRLFQEGELEKWRTYLKNIKEEYK